MGSSGVRDRYKGVDASELEAIPAKAVEGFGESTSVRRVAAYVRVSTDNDEQTSSYELQKNYYTEYIKAQPGWEFVGIYDDEGISGTSLEHRKGMQQLIEDCKAGKIDLVLTKSIARFARNIVDCLSVIETLKNLDPPVGKIRGRQYLYAGQQWPHDPDHSGICGGGRTSFQINYYELVY